MKQFSLVRPPTAAAAAGIRSEDEFSAFYAGGTELLLAMKKGYLIYDTLIDLKRIPGLADLTIDEAEQVLRIGAAVTHARVERDPRVQLHLPILAEVERQIANVRVRAVGTLAGNLCFAEPRSDLAALGILLGGYVVLHGPEGQRTLPVESFLVGPYETALAPGELLIELVLPLQSGLTGVGYQRFKHQERPAAATGVFLQVAPGTQQVAAARVVVGCVGPTPQRIPEAEALLVGAALTDVEALAALVGRAAGERAEVIPDLTFSEEYRRHLVGVLVKRACLTAAASVEEGDRDVAP
jgi:carbon-monoxide dehydrogenase medium subunit